MSVDLFTPQEQGSPFDAIRQVRADGSEYWSARDLMPLLGYDRWENFDISIGRAQAACINAGFIPTDHFRDVTKKVMTRGVAPVNAADFELTRYGAYMLALECDGRKPEVATAKTYFAVQTRRAETMAQFQIPQTYAEALRLAANQAEAIEALEAKTEALEGPAQAWDDLASPGADLCFSDAAKTLARAGVDTGQNRLFTWMDRHGWIYRQDGIWHAYQSAVKAGWLVQKIGPAYMHGNQRHHAVQVRITTRGMERLLKLMAPETVTP